MGQLLIDVIQRLDAMQTRKILHDLAPGYTEMRNPEPVTELAVSSFCVPIAESPAGRVYGLFDAKLDPQGFLVGMIVPDPFTGVRVGFEHYWWARKGTNGLPLLAAFEAECRREKCVRLLGGYMELCDPARLKKIYERRGYKQSQVSVTKELN